MANGGLRDIKVAIPAGFAELPTHTFGRVGRLFERDFDANNLYTFVETIANPEAVKAVDSAGLRRQTLDGSARLYFDRSVANLYLSVLYDLLGSHDHYYHYEGFSEGNFIYYPLVDARGEEHRDYPSWPVVHVAIDRKESLPHAKRFRDTVDQLKGGHAFSLIKGREAPQNYRMGQIEAVRRSGLAPLVIQDSIGTVTGEELGRFISVLAPFSYSPIEKHECGPDCD
jgi:hypothetical protein